MKNKVIAIVSVIAIVLTMSIAMTGCSKDAVKKDNPTVTATQTVGQNSAGSDSGNQSGNQNNGVLVGGISAGDAESKALTNTSQYGGQFVTITEKATYENTDCWRIGVKTSDGRMLVCYVTSDMCVVEELDYDSSKGVTPADGAYAGTTADAAYSTALSAVGEGNWSAESANQGYYQSVEAWVVRLVNNDTGDVKIAYVAGSDCYF